jgi:hypothetical protein
MKEKFDINKEDSRKLLSRVVLGLVAIFGVIFIIIGALAMYQQYVYRTKYSKVVGSVTSNMTDSEGRYIPTYIYEVDGTTYTTQSDYSFTTMPEIGTQHTIYYLPEKVAYGIAEYFDANQLLVVIGAMMLTLPLAIYLLDTDSQMYDKHAKLKGFTVALLGALYYWGSATILNNYSISYIFNYSGVLVVVPIVYIIIGIYAIIVSKYIKDNKLHFHLFKIHKKKEE